MARIDKTRIRQVLSKLEKRPKINIIPTSFENRLERVGIAFMIAIWAFVGYFIVSMPPIVPIHFNGLGKPDNYGSKFTFVILPVLGTIIYFGIGKLANYPHIFNYPTKITEANAKRQYSIAVQMLRILKVTLAFLFLVILLYVYLNVKGMVDGLGIWFLPFTLTLVLVPLAAGLRQSLKNN